MSRLRRRTAAAPSRDQSGDRAHLPLRHPRLVAHRSDGHREGRLPSPGEHRLMLSDGGLGRVDSHCIDQIRKDLSNEFPVPRWPAASRARGRGISWKWLVLTACYLALAIGAGLTIGYVL